MVSLPSLSHDLKCACITEYTHLQVVGLRLESNLVNITVGVSIVIGVCD